MARNKITLYWNKPARNYWSRYFLKEAWKNLSEEQLKDELRYTKGILGINKIGVIFSDKTHEDWGRRVKDFVYGYWTEEDIRLKLASQLTQFNDCQIHGQVHIRGTKNVKSDGYKPKGFHIHMYPDLLFISFKKKERNVQAKEKNIESTAIEIKYFFAGWNERDLKDKISRDLDKLISYQKKRLNPKVDCGYFFCIDESGKVERILADLFLKKRYKKCPLGYGILIPRYTNLNLNYPRKFESLERGEDRKINYLLDYIRGQLSDIYFDRKLFPNKEKYGYWLSFRKEPSGWIQITWPKYIEGLNRKYLGVMIRVYEPNKSLVKRYPQCGWAYDKNKWIRTEKNTGRVLIYRINRKYLSKLKRIEKYGGIIASILRKIHNKMHN